MTAKSSNEGGYTQVELTFDISFAFLLLFSLDSLLMDSSLAYDTLLVLASTVRSLGSSRDLLPGSGGASCSRERPWAYGPTFFNYLNAAQVEGITGKVVFKARKRMSLILFLLLCHTDAVPIDAMALSLVAF